MTRGSPIHAPASQRSNPSSQPVSFRGRSQIPRPSGLPIASSSRRGSLRPVKRSLGLDPGPAPVAGSLLQSVSNVAIHGGQFSTNQNFVVILNRDDPQFVSNPPASEHSSQAAETETGQLQSRDLVPREPTRVQQTSLPVQKSCDIYYRQLAVMGHGSPLWIPEPNDRLHIEYRRKGICIGDVGIIADDGSFDFMRPREAPDGWCPQFCGFEA